MSNHETKTEEYNPARDYSKVMNWFKWGAVIVIALTLFLRFLIG